MLDEDAVAKCFQNALDGLKPSEGALIINNLTINIIHTSGHNAHVLVDSEEARPSYRG